MKPRLLAMAVQVATFGLVGVVATIVHYAVALSLTRVMPLAFANPLGFAVAFCVSYFGHLRYTFRIAGEQSNHRSRLPRFLVVALLGFLVGQTIIVLPFHSLPDWLSLLLAVTAAPVTTFIASKLWVFRQNHST